MGWKTFLELFLWEDFFLKNIFGQREIEKEIERSLGLNGKRRLWFSKTSNKDCNPFQSLERKERKR